MPFPDLIHTCSQMLIYFLLDLALSTRTIIIEAVSFRWEGASRASSRCGAGCGWPPRCRALDADDLEIRSTRTGADAGNTGGRSKYMSGRQLARTGRVGASDNPWDMEQAAKSIRVRNAGEELRPRPGSAQRWAGPTARVPTHTGCPQRKHAGAAGAVKRPVVPHALSGKEDKRRPASPGAGQNAGR